MRKLFDIMSSIRMRDESIEDYEMSVFPLDQRPRRQPTATIEDERTNYTAPVVTLLTVKEAIAVWSREDRQELYEHLNRVYQVRMR
jgi:hypothetical protein